MGIYKEGQKLEFASEDGIWVDYKDHVWYFFVKDCVWQQEEIRNAHKNEVTVSLISHCAVDAFLLEIFDCLEPSDLPFCVKDVDPSVFDGVDDSVEERYEIVLVDENGMVKAVRENAFEHANSQIIHHLIKDRMDQSYTSDDFDKAYERLVTTYEPFEMEKYALFVQKDRK